MNNNAGYRADPRSVSFAPIPSGLKWVSIVLVALSCLGFVAAVGLWTGAIVSSPDRPDDDLMGIGAIAFIVTMLMVYAHAFVGLGWLYKAWAWLPVEERYTKHWRSWISPGQAALFLLIPYFQYYWMFVINCGLCDAFDRLRVRFPTRQAAPKSLAIVAGVMQIVVPLPVGMILWLVFMSKIEAMSREMSAAAAAQAPRAF